MTEQEMIARGQKLHEACYGGLHPTPTEIDPKGYTGMAMKMFNDFWGDERLGFRDKRLLILGVTGALGAEAAFLVHAKCALANGELTGEEVRSAVLMILPYAGYPRVSKLTRAVEELIAEHEQG